MEGITAVRAARTVTSKLLLAVTVEQRVAFLCARDKSGRMPGSAIDR
jgi:hypothetical protein